MKKTNVFPKGKFVLVTTNQEFDYVEYLGYCDTNNIKPSAEDSDDFRKWCLETAQVYIADDFIELKRIGEKYLWHSIFVIEGSVGTWQGKRNIQPLISHDLVSAIETCIGNCDYYDVTWENGTIFVSASHHDGNNYFEIKQLSAKGKENYRRLLSFGKRFYHPKDSDKKRIPHPFYLY